ncbi:MAG: V-type ATPase 116kDa subunit family protein [Clostridia bacterium]
MAIKAYLMIRDGHLLDAIFDIGSWWVLFGGVVFALLGMMQLGLILMGVGALALLLTQGRHEKNFFKKITKGLSSLYDITSYLGDILSYSRLLALGLASAVIASVINTMGLLTGPVGFIIIFIFGQAFNLAINLIGTFVHTARLQYVEFFSKFYEGGGVPFEPLEVRTKYVDIMKEEN